MVIGVTNQLRYRLGPHFVELIRDGLTTSSVVFPPPSEHCCYQNMGVVAKSYLDLDPSSIHKHGQK